MLIYSFFGIGESVESYFNKIIYIDTLSIDFPNKMTEHLFFLIMER